MPSRYVYRGCPRCGEIRLIPAELTGDDCLPCQYEGSFTTPIAATVARTSAMSNFKQGQKAEGRALEALAVAIDAAEFARRRAQSILVRAKENEQ